MAKGEKVVKPMIVGDIGGTNIRFAIANTDRNGLPNLEHVWSSPSKSFCAFGDALEHFLTIASPNKNPLKGVFALAGPVDKNTVKLTNNSWIVKRDDLKTRFGFERLVFINDFAAMARSIPELPSKAFKTLQTGDISCVLSANSTTAVAGAGTGLGQALLIRDKSTKWAVLPGEGGHQPYSPVNKLEKEIHKLLQHKLKYVSFEDICSGQGLENVYEALLKINGLENKTLDAKSITEEANRGSLVSIQTCEFTANTLMSFIGNAVLSSGSWHGAVLAGGVSQHLKEYLGADSALEKFKNKGKMTKRMENVPLRLLIDPTAPLIGAASSN